MLKDHDESTYFLDKIDMTRMLTDSGASQEIAEQVMENYESSVKSDRFKPAVAGTKSMSISSQNMKVSVKKDASDQLEIKIIDGRKYLLLPVDCVEVNGFAL